MPNKPSFHVSMHNNNRLTELEADVVVTALQLVLNKAEALGLTEDQASRIEQAALRRACNKINNALSRTLKRRRYRPKFTLGAPVAAFPSPPDEEPAS